MRFGLLVAESFFLLSFTASLAAQTPAVTLESATLTINPLSRDSYTLQGAFSGLSFTDSQAVTLKVGQFSGTIPIDKFVRQPGSSVLLYEDATGLAPYWVSSLLLDTDARTFQAQANGIVLAGLPNPFSVQLGADQISGCAMARHGEDR